MRMLLLQTKKNLKPEDMGQILQNIETAMDNGVLIIDADWTYEIIDIEDVKTHVIRKS